MSELQCFGRNGKCVQKKLTEPGNSDNFCGEEWQSEAPFKLDPTIKKEEDFALSTITMVSFFSDRREIVSLDQFIILLKMETRAGLL